MTEPLLHSLGLASVRAADLLVGSVWMGLVLVGCVALLLRCLPRLSATARSGIWTTVMAAVLLLPFVSFHRMGTAGAERSVVHAAATWSYLLAGVWAACSLVRLAQLGASAVRLRQVARRAVPVEITEGLAELLARGSRRVRLSVSGDVSRPSVAGFFRPQILLPVGLLEELSEAEIEHVVLHELEHLRRRDDWTNLLQKLGLALFPLHPAMFWLDRRLCLERELACDEGVLRVTRARKAYAACLARLAEDSMVRRGLSLALGFLGGRERRSELSRRVHRILASPAAAMGRLQVGALTALVLAGVLGGSLLVTRSPRLISFGEFPETRAQAEAPALPMVSEPEGAMTPFRAVATKALMPSADGRPAMEAVSQAPRVVRAAAVSTAAVSRKARSTSRRVALAQQKESVVEAQGYVVFTAWEQQGTMPRMTLAVARETTDFRDPQSTQSDLITREPQPTYAAVPVRGGWLLIQL